MANNTPQLVLRLPGERPVKNTDALYLMAFVWYWIFDKLGDRNATYYLAVLYFCGSGMVRCNHYKAFALFKKAAVKGHPLALYNMFLCLINGYGFNKDLSIAGDALRLAAEGGYEPAVIKYAAALYDGRPDWGVEQDYAKALPWLERIKDKDPKYLAAIGNIYYNNKGVERDYAKAVEYYWEAGDKGLAIAWTGLGDAYAYGNGVERNYDKAVECYVYGIRRGSGTDIFDKMEKTGIENKIAYLQGDTQDKLVALADAYYYGRDKLKKNQKTAFRLYQMLSDTHTRARCMEAVCIAEKIKQGRSVKDYQDALSTIMDLTDQYPSSTSFSEGYWVLAKAAVLSDMWDHAARQAERAANEGCAPAMHQIGECYLHGKGVERNTKKGFEWLKKACSVGYYEASYDLGICYMKGEGCAVDYHQALMCFYDSWNNLENTQAALGLALLYGLGQGTKRDVPQARRLVKRVLEIEPDNEQAKDILAKL